MPPSGAGARARTLARTLALLALLVLSPGIASAEPGSVPAGETAVDLVRNFWDLVAESAGRGAHGPSGVPGHRARAQGAAPVDLSDLANPARIESRLKSALAPRDGAVRLTVSEGTARLGDYRIGAADADRGSPARGAGRRGRVRPPARQPRHGGGRRDRAPGRAGLGRHPHAGRRWCATWAGEIGGEVRTLRHTSIIAPLRAVAASGADRAGDVIGRRLAGVVGVFLTLAVLGFGLVMFGRPNLEVVSDTASHSFGRAFVTGLLGQILLLPTFGMLIVGPDPERRRHPAAAVRGRGVRPAGDRRGAWAGSSPWRTRWARPIPGGGWHWAR